MSTSESATAAAAVNNENIACKLYVGNLSYSTTEDDLKTFFAKAGQVADAKIISYRGRSKGFGFVTMNSEKEAENAFTSLQGSELQERPIKIEKATPQVPRTEDSAPARRGRGGRRGGRGGRRSNGTQHTGPASKTVIYVGNLPYVATDEDLKNVFDEYGFVKAHVVRRSDGSSKGFGFVTVATEANQASALSDLANVEIDGRRLYIRAAQSEESYDERQAKAAATETA